MYFDYSLKAKGSLTGKCFSYEEVQTMSKDKQRLINQAAVKVRKDRDHLISDEDLYQQGISEIEKIVRDYDAAELAKANQPNPTDEKTSQQEINDEGEDQEMIEELVKDNQQQIEKPHDATNEIVKQAEIEQ